MTIDEATKMAREVEAAYTSLNAAAGRSSWTASDYASGLVGDVGDLIKLVMAYDGKRDGDATHAALSHELSDCLWSVLVLADKLDVDLAAIFPEQMNRLLDRLSVQVAPKGVKY